MKVAINTKNTKYKLSDKQIERYALLKGYTFKRKFNDISLSDIPPGFIKEDFMWYSTTYLLNDTPFDPYSIPRNDPTLIQIIESSPECLIDIVEIPDDIDFIIENCNGIEWISEKHRTWRVPST